MGGSTTGIGTRLFLIRSVVSWWRGLDPAEASALRRAFRTMALLAALEAAAAAGVVAALARGVGGHGAAAPSSAGTVPPRGATVIARASLAAELPPAVAAPAREARDTDTDPVGRGPQAAAVDDPPPGRELFARQWLPHDPRCHGGDGLGPVYNERSCLACHGQGAPGGAGPEDANVEILTLTANNFKAGGKVNLRSLSGVSITNSIITGAPNGSRLYMELPGAGIVASAGGRRLSGRGFEIYTEDDGCAMVASSELGEVRGPTVTVRPDDVTLSNVHPALLSAMSVVFHRSGVDPQYEQWRSNRKGIRVELGLSLQGGIVNLSRRNPPPLFGAGLIDALPDEVFIETAARQPETTRGRVSRMADGRIGRFGWKAQVATLEDFVLSACANELGLEVPGHHQPASPFAPAAVAPSLDLTQAECRALVDFVKELPAPVQIRPSSLSGATARDDGARLFEQVGCTACHTPSVGPIEGIYSDLLLHDIGLDDVAVYYGSGSDTESPGAAAGNEWRTPPLWGIRDSAPYMHDGRARTLTEAIKLHAGQAALAAKEFASLSVREEQQILAFLGSLSAPVGADEIRRRQADPDFEAGRSPLAALLDVPHGERRRSAAAARTGGQRRLHHGQAATPAEERLQREAVRAGHLAALLHSAQALERMGKIRGALEFYGALVREAPNSAEARTATERIKASASR